MVIVLTQTLSLLHCAISPKFCMGSEKKKRLQRHNVVSTGLGYPSHRCRGDPVPRRDFWPSDDQSRALPRVGCPFA